MSKYVQKGSFPPRFGEYTGHVCLAHAGLIPDAHDLGPQLVAQLNGGYFPRIRKVVRFPPSSGTLHVRGSFPDKALLDEGLDVLSKMGYVEPRRLRDSILGHCI